MKFFYITTPLYYVNDTPHLGTAYTTVLADVLNRYHQLIGYKTFFLTGTDEHGQKIATAYQKQQTHLKTNGSQKKPVDQDITNQQIQNHCNQMAQHFKDLWGALNISYDKFFRTTDNFHKEQVQKKLQELYDKQYIYESTYEGWYCVSEEIFYTKKDLVNGLSPTGKEVIEIKEKNYFFKMSAFQKPLLDYIKKHPNFIQPLHKKNEILGFLKKDLNDLCISRPKSRVSWGISLPFDSNYVCYVWVDALLNYVNGVHNDFDKWWNRTGALHLIGKDILITHCVYWPCLLMALGVKLPKTILAHGWILNKSQQKMSKSFGSVMDPLELIKTYSTDSLRYFLIKDLPIEKDSPVSHPLILRRINEDLSNNLGNLVSRTCHLIHRHFESQIPARGPTCSIEQGLRKQGALLLKQAKEDIYHLQPQAILNRVIHLLSATNQFLEQKAPWKSIKTDKLATGLVLREALEVIYLSAVLLRPVMPHKMDQLLSTLACPKQQWPESFFKEGVFPKAGECIAKADPLFPRLKLG